ncbi:MAG TPA: proton-conducting transporter membrane subunit, partial [Spirochaetota bacterium]
MNSLLFLILFPLVPAFLLLIFPFNRFRAYVTRLSVAVIGAGAIYAAYQFFFTSAQFYSLPSHYIDKGMFYIEAAITLFIIVLGIRYKKYLASVFALLSFGVMAYFELKLAHGVHVEQNLFIDKFSVIMALIIGIIGGLICIYAIGYMNDFHHHHKEMKDKRPLFFFILFVFLSAMFGIVFSNNIVWLFFFWEITTLTSFLLIGYTKTQEAINNSFRALIMNLSGGLAFALAIAYLAKTGGPLELDKIIAGKGAIAMIPVALLCFAGITKSAQLPFSSWLLGAMVAPTPTSALLHSSTMVKAGVYLVIRLAPVLQNTNVGNMVALIGGITFLIGAFIAVSQSNAKKLLAWSTISNLGLIIACAGIGSSETVWAGIFLIIFHAIAKSLLFLCVGTIEHKLGSRDIENMDSLIVSMPGLTMMVIVGICGMFIAPFGMLISKWAALKAFITIPSFMSPVLILFLSFGSATTIFFWTKWMGKITAANRPAEKEHPLQKSISGDEWTSELIHAVLTVAICLGFPLVSAYLVEPYVSNLYGSAAGIGKGNYVIMTIMVAMIILLPLIDFFFQTRLKTVKGTAYMAGRNESPNRVFDGSLGAKREMTLKNYYLE